MADQQPQEITRETIRLLQRRGAQLVEVLAKDEYERVHLAGAINVPLAMISRRTADKLDWQKPVIVYSRDGLCDRSARAAWRLTGLGFIQVFRYSAGKADWVANGLPVEGSEAQIAAAGDLADMDVPTCKAKERVEEVRRRVQQDGGDTCVVINDELVVLGLLNQIDLEKANQTWTAEEAMDRDPETFRLDTPVEQVQAFFLAHGHITNGLVTTTDGKLYGLIRRSMVSP